MNRPQTIDEHSWPVSRLGEALGLLATKSGLPVTSSDIPESPPPDIASRLDALDAWLDTVARQLGLECERTDAAYHDHESLLRNGGPALVRLALPENQEPRFLALIQGRGSRAAVIGQNHALHWLPIETIGAALCPEQVTQSAALDQILEKAGVPENRRAASKKAILREQLGEHRVRGCWLLRQPPSGNVRVLIRQARLGRWLLALLGGHTIQSLLWLLAWWMIGLTALQGRYDAGWLLAWAMVVLSMVPFQLLVTWSQGMLAIGGGTLLKQRLLLGALRLSPEEIRHQGSGQLLGRILEAEVLQSLALSGGFLGLVAGIELILAALVLGLGLAGWLQILLLLLWMGFVAWLAGRYFHIRKQWTETRLAMTHDLVERMVGHRTRLAQELPERWHDGEDQALDRYQAQSKAMDRNESILLGLVPRGWLVLGMIGLIYPFVWANSTPAQLAMALGGVLLAYRALQKLALGLSHLISARIAWLQIAPLLAAARRPELIGSPKFVSPQNPPETSGSKNGRKLLEAHDLVFRYRPHGEAVLRRCNLTLQRGDRILLEGPSGGGKSTLASVLTTLRNPESGLLLLQGLDRQTLGTANWRRRVVSAPQFHENHLLSASFAFNLLMGRCWPPQVEDLQQAESICRELGLDEVVQRMPAGPQQMVGETGWQLSQGEKSRLYLARALLQNADLVILDESFASLDPINLRRALQCVMKRAKTLLVIAHP